MTYEEIPYMDKSIQLSLYKLNKKQKHLDWWNMKTLNTGLQQYGLCVFFPSSHLQVINKVYE